MTNASLKEQLQAVAGQLDAVPKQRKAPESKPAPHQKSRPRPPVAREAKANPNPKPKWLDYVQYGVELLRAYFPNCFKSMKEVQPLKVGIKQDLVLRLSTVSQLVTEDKVCMIKSLAYYVNTHAYHKSVVPGRQRVDLDGNSAGTVSEEEARYSTDRQQAKQLAKQQAEQRDKQPAMEVVA